VFRERDHESDVPVAERNAFVVVGASVVVVYIVPFVAADKREVAC